MASGRYSYTINRNDTKTQLYVFVDTNDRKIDIAIAMIDPRSRGYVKIRSADHSIDPIIDPKYFSDEQDMKISIRAIKRYVKSTIVSKVLKRNNISIVRAFLPGCGVWNQVTLLNDSFLKCLIRMNSHTIYHYVSTCRMGRRTNRDAAVDTTLSLIGVQNVRVIDASVMPRITRGNTNAPVSMIAERGAKFIMRKYSRGSN